MASSAKGRSSVWGDSQISRPRIPLEVAIEIDRIRSQIQDPSKAKNGYPTIFITPDMSDHFYVKILGLVHDVMPEEALSGKD